MNEIANILTEALARFNRAETKYGKFEPDVDVRNLVMETKEEIFDAINYLTMFIAWLDGVDKKHAILKESIKEK